MKAEAATTLMVFGRKASNFHFTMSGGLIGAVTRIMIRLMTDWSGCLNNQSISKRIGGDEHLLDMLESSSIMTIIRAMRMFQF
tara:strand:+ start:439 stop:687 length:249 start_codon:yes stop_codon:yes gene_type:complete